MPELPNRDKHERQMATAIYLLFRQHEKLAASGHYSAGGLRADLSGAMIPTLAQVYMESAMQLAVAQGVRLDAQALRSEAFAWAGSYADGLAGDIAASIAEAVADARRTAETAAALAVLLSGIFAQSRATNIAITETTSGITRGEQSTVARFESETGTMLIPIWQTERDARVCAICSPLDQKRAEVWQGRHPAGPPAHPRCRCFLTYKADVLVGAGAN